MSTPTEIVLNPKNDFGFFATLWSINLTTGAKTPLTTGSVSVFLATSDDPTAGPADATLTGTATHVGNGKWLIFVDATKLGDVALLDSLFLAGGAVYVVLEQTNNIRAALPVPYVRNRDIVLT